MSGKERKCRGWLGGTWWESHQRSTSEGPNLSSFYPELTQAIEPLIRNTLFITPIPIKNYDIIQNTNPYTSMLLI